METVKPQNVEIWDGHNFTPIKTLQRHEADDFMVTIVTENGFSFSCKRTHPSFAKFTLEGDEVIVSAEELLDMFVLTEQGYSRVMNISHSTYEGQLYDVSTESEAYMADGIRTHNSFHCLDQESLVVIKENGVIYTKTLKELFSYIESFSGDQKEEDLEFCLNKKDIEIWAKTGWTSLLAIHRHKPKEPIVAISNGQTILIGQDNHPMAVAANKNVCNYCKFHNMVKPSKRARNQNVLRCTRCWKQQAPKTYNKKDLYFKYIRDINPNDEYMYKNLKFLDEVTIVIPKHDPYIVGMFISEGNCQFVATDGGSTKNNENVEATSIQIHQNPGEIKDKIVAKVRELYPERYTVRNRTITIRDDVLAEEFHEMYGRYSWNKHLPSDFIHYPKEWLVDFLCAYIEGDGTISIKKTGKGTGNVIIDTVSFSLLQQLQIICFKLNLVSTMLLTPNRAKTDWQGFRLNIRLTEEAKTMLKDCVKVHKINVCSPPQNVCLEEFKPVSYTKPVIYNREHVYDVTTADGTVSICGILTHNTGGAAVSRGAQSVSALQRAQMLLNLPKTLPDSAILAKSTGTVTKIEKDPSTNGHYVFIKNEKDETKHYVPSHKELLISHGSTINKGDQLSNGLINPHHLLQLKNMDSVRDYLTEELYKVYKNVGGTRRRNVEVVVKNLTNLTEVADGGASEHIPGDIVPLNKVQTFNSQVKNPLDKILHKPILKGVKEAALLKSEDYIDRMNFQRIQHTLIEGAGKGWKTTSRGSSSPLSGWAQSTIDVQKDKNDPRY